MSTTHDGPDPKDAAEVIAQLRAGTSTLSEAPRAFEPGNRKNIALWYRANWKWCCLPAFEKQPGVPWRWEVIPALPSRAWLEDQWAGRDGYNISILTGTRSMLVVADVDPRHEGRVEVLWERGWPKDTVVARSGSGGWHVYCGCPPDGLHSVPLYAQGIEVKADGAQVIAPPSRHPDKPYNLYEWVVGREPWNMPVAPLPESVIEEIRGMRPTPAATETVPVELTKEDIKRLAKKAPGLVKKAVARARANQDGGRHNTCVWLACQLRDSRVSNEVGRACILAYQRELEVLNV